MKADMAATDNDVAEWGRIVFCLKPRCPICGSDNLRTLKSRPQESDGSRTRETVCRDCHHNFLLVIE